MSAALMSPPGIYLTTFLYSLLAGLVPVLNVEVYLVSLSALSPQTAALPTVIAASTGQMAAKVVLYLAGRGLLKLPIASRSPRVQRAAAGLVAAKKRGTTVVFASSLTGIPPFYGVSLAAGLLRFPLPCFVAAGSLGRVVRFAATFLLPRLL